MRVRFLTYLLCAFALYSTSLAQAQVVAGKSRLNVGQTPKKTNVSVLAPVRNYAVSTKVPTEVRLNNTGAVNEFYRQLLLTNPSKPTASKQEVRSVSNPSEGSDEFLYNSDKLRISNVYPNPANDFAKFDYKISTNNTKANLTIYNLLGTKMGNYELNTFDNELEVSTRNWDSGVYLYQLVLDGKKVATKKLLVRHN